MRYTQPQSGPLLLDSSNPITRGLAFVFVSLNGQAVGWRAGKNTSIDAVSNAVRVLTPQGKALAAASSVDMLYDTGLTGITTSNYGLFAAATANTSGVQSAIDDDLGSGLARVFQFRLNSFQTTLITFDTVGNPYTVTSAATLSAAQINAGFTMGAQVAGNAIAVFQNGVKTTGTASGTPKTSLGDLRVGNYKGGASSGWSTGGISITVGWLRTPTDVEFRSMAANPWQLFRSPQRVMLASVSAANLTGTSQTSSLSLGSINTAVRLAGTSGMGSISSGALLTGIPLTGSNGTPVFSNGALTTIIKLAGTSSTSSAGSGALLSVGIALTGSSSTPVFSSGVLTTAINLAGTSTSPAMSSGSLLSNAAALAGTSSVSVSSSAALATGISLAGTSRTLSVSLGNINTAINLTGTSQISSVSSGGINTLPIVNVIPVAQRVVFSGGTNRVIFDGGTPRAVFDSSTTHVIFNGGINNATF